MREPRSRALRNELLDLPPVALVVADFLAGHADGQEAAEDLDLLEGAFAVRHEPLALFFGLFWLNWEMGWITRADLEALLPKPGRSLPGA